MNSITEKSGLDQAAISPARSEPVISVRGLVKRYGSHEAVAGIDLEVRRGEIFACLGPNGAGKPVTELWLSLPVGHGRWTGRRLASVGAAVCRSPEDARDACLQDLPTSVAAGARPRCRRQTRA
jgi:ABC-type glutathione transport system ATPase component